MGRKYYVRFYAMDNGALQERCCAWVDSFKKACELQNEEGYASHEILYAVVIDENNLHYLLKHFNDEFEMNFDGLVHDSITEEIYPAFICPQYFTK